jgi:hypothetical protein
MAWNITELDRKIWGGLEIRNTSPGNEKSVVTFWWYHAVKNITYKEEYPFFGRNMAPPLVSTTIYNSSNLNK